MRSGAAVLFFFLSLVCAQAQQQGPDSLPGCIFNSAPVTLSNGQRTTIQCDNKGNLLINLGGASGGTLSVKSGAYVSAGAGQFALAVGTNTQLTVPAGTVCAEITVEGANIRRTSDTTGATTTNGTLIQAGAQWQDCGPLAAYKFTAVSGSPTLDVEYFK